LVDCAGDFDNYGCNGGLPSHAFEYIKYNGGLTTEDKYPYLAVDSGSCKLQKGTQVVGVLGGSFNISLSEDALRNSLFQVGPISVAFQVIAGFKDYKTGVYTTGNCQNGPMDVNHAVLAVGYGTDNGMDYWIIKNSWGAAWGDNGYFKMQRGVNMCGIVNCNSYPFDVIDLTSYPQAFLE
jgi:cathepsin H